MCVEIISPWNSFHATESMSEQAREQSILQPGASEGGRVSKQWSKQGREQVIQKPGA